jgi:hypothetical protein
MCSDGDMVLFAGLLCSVGEGIGCETVRRSQQLQTGDDYGRWYRSPRRMETGNDADQDGRVPEDEGENEDQDADGRKNEREWNTFSFDMALGTMLFLATTRGTPADVERGQHWFEWIHNYTPTLFGDQKGLPRLCGHRDCTLLTNPFGNHYAMFGEIASFGPYKLPDGVFKKLIEQDSGKADSRLLLDARLNDDGFSEHLVAVSIYLKRLMGRDSDDLSNAAALLNCAKPIDLIGRLMLDARTCTQKTPENGFFRYLRDGPTDAVRQLTLATCPSPEQRSEVPSYWIWESAGDNLTARRSMYWDCIFMGRLLGAE